MDYLDDAEVLARAEARAEAELLDAQEELGRWIPFADPSLLYLKAFAPLYELWDRITIRGEQVFALVSAPPRHTKTTTCFHGIARHLRLHPKARIGFASYNQDIAFTQSRLCRAIAARSGVWTSEEKLERDKFAVSASVAHWQTSAGGGCKFMGRGGSAIGLGFDVAIVDDPIKNREEAESELILRNTVTWIKSSILNRLEKKGSFILIHQRWCEDDPIGHFLAQIEAGYPDMPEELRQILGGLPPWTIITLKAIQDDGQSLAPERYSRLDLARIEAEVGPLNWASQYQQDPRPSGERLFPENYPVWTTDRDAGGRELGIGIDGGRWIPAPRLVGKQLVLGVDTATTENATSDFTSVVLLAFGWEHDEQTQRLELSADVLHVWRERLKSPDVVEFVASIGKAIDSAVLAYETAGPGLVQSQFMKRDHPELAVHEVRTSTSKKIRATPVAGAAGRGRMRVPITAPWLAPFLAELRKFTGNSGKHDDQVDALAHAWNFAAESIQRPIAGRTGGERSLAARGTGGF